jgi:hypothetical protein
MGLGFVWTIVQQTMKANVDDCGMTIMAASRSAWTVSVVSMQKVSAS